MFEATPKALKTSFNRLQHIEYQCVFLYILSTKDLSEETHVCNLFLYR